MRHCNNKPSRAPRVRLCVAVIAALLFVATMVYVSVEENIHFSRGVTSAPKSAPKEKEFDSSDTLLGPDRAHREPVVLESQVNNCPTNAIVGIAGRVLDDLGTPVHKFCLEIARPGSEQDEFSTNIEGLLNGIEGAQRARLEWELVESGHRSMLRQFAESNGRFYLPKLSSGKWQLRASGGRMHKSQTVLVDAGVPSEVVLILPRPAIVRGLVCDATGKGIQKAELKATRGDASVLLSASESTCLTDTSGRFTMQGLGPGTVRIMARHTHYSDSEGTDVTLKPGELRADVLITLTSGGRIEGELSPLVGPLGNRSISLFSFRGNFGWRDTKTDAAGHFVIDHVVPQRYVIELFPDPTSLRRPASQGSIRKNIVVKEGETTKVWFGGPEMQIVVHGNVASRGVPRAGLVVSAESMDGADQSGESIATGNDGRYELLVPSAGKYWFRIAAREGSEVAFERFVSQEAFVEIHFEVPEGSLSGRVLNSEGVAVPQVPVSLVRVSEDSLGEFASRLYSGNDGSFVFSLLRAGVYTLRAPDGYWQDRPPRRVPYGRVIYTGVRIAEEQAAVLLDIRLPAEVRASGVVVDANGLAVSGARIVLKDETGQSLSAFWDAESDAAGEFEIFSVAPGTYTAYAYTQEKNGNSEPFLASVGESAVVRIVLH